MEELDSEEALDEMISDEEDSWTLLDETDPLDELDVMEELEDIADDENATDEDDLTVMSTLKRMNSLSDASVMLVREIFMSLLFQKMNLLNEVTFWEPGNTSDDVAVVPLSG